MRNLNARLGAVYQKAFYETCELVEGMSTNLRKLLVTGSAQQEQVLLSEIARQAQGAQDDLSQLPLGEGAVSATIKFVNQAGGLRHFAGRGSGGRRGHQRRGLRDHLHTFRERGRALRAPRATACALRGRRGRVRRGHGRNGAGEPLSADRPGGSPTRHCCTTGPSPTPPGRREYRAHAGLPDVDAAGAERALRAFLGAGGGDRAAPGGREQHPVECYEFTVTANGYSISAGVTKAGRAGALHAAQRGRGRSRPP